MFKKLHGRGRIAALAAGVLIASFLISPAAAEAAAPAQAKTAFSWAYVTPSPEHWETKRMSQQEATDWVNRCPHLRFCTWIRDDDGVTYDLFQFVRCQEYALSDWLGTTNFYNNQTVRVQLLGSRHEHIRYLGVGQQFITNWDPVWFINLCA